MKYQQNQEIVTIFSSSSSSKNKQDFVLLCLQKCLAKIEFIIINFNTKNIWIFKKPTI
jgi:hypothetical protein